MRSISPYTVNMTKKSRYAVAKGLDVDKERRYSKKVGIMSSDR